LFCAAGARLHFSSAIQSAARMDEPKIRTCLDRVIRLNFGSNKQDSPRSAVHIVVAVRHEETNHMFTSVMRGAAECAH
jgi:hypothetical protein